MKLEQACPEYMASLLGGYISQYLKNIRNWIFLVFANLLKMAAKRELNM
jgi:hypothetical protein